jgi:hypothetical protein
LKPGFFNEAHLPSLKGCPVPVEDCVVSLLPNEPGTKHEDLHEKLRVELLSGFYHHHVKGKIDVPANSKVIPTLRAKGAFEEQVECGFFHAHGSYKAVVVVVLYLVLLSS